MSTNQMNQTQKHDSLDWRMKMVVIISIKNIVNFLCSRTANVKIVCKKGKYMSH